MKQPICCPRIRRPGVSWMLGGLLLLAPACKLAKKAVELPGKVLHTSTPADRVSLSRLQTTVMRFTDGFTAQIVQATSEFAEAVGTPEGRIQALTWRVGQATSALTIASGPNPNANLFDMLVLVTLGRMAHEEYWMPEVYGPADQPMVDAYKRLEEEILEIAGQVLKPEQIQDVQETIREWREKNPGPALTAFVKLPTFRKLLDSREKKSNVFQELADLLSLDPLEGLEPATREAAELRVLGERTLFYGQRAPLIFTTQAELLGLKLAQIPEVKQAVEGGGRLSAAAEKIAESAAGLPETVRQISEEMTAQREALVRDLEAAQGPTGQILSDARATLEAGKGMSTELKGAIDSFDTMMKRFEKQPGDAQGSEKPGRPFDVREYGESAAQIGTAAKELNELLSNLERKVPETKNLLDEASDRSDGVVVRALNRLFVIGLVLIAAAAIASLAVRRISARWHRPSPGA